MHILHLQTTKGKITVERDGGRAQLDTTIVLPQRDGVYNFQAESLSAHGGAAIIAGTVNIKASKFRNPELAALDGRDLPASFRIENQELRLYEVPPPYLHAEVIEGNGNFLVGFLKKEDPSSGRIARSVCIWNAEGRPHLLTGPARLAGEVTVMSLDVTGMAAGRFRVNGTSPQPTLPIFWPSEKEQGILLKLPPNCSGGAAHGLNPHGTVVGAVYDRRAELTRACVWPKPDCAFFLPLPSQYAGCRSEAASISEYGQIIGSVLLEDGSRQTLLWQMGRIAPNGKHIEIPVPTLVAPAFKYAERKFTAVCGQRSFEKIWFEDANAPLEFSCYALTSDRVLSRVSFGASLRQELGETTGIQDANHNSWLLDAESGFHRMPLILS